MPDWSALKESVETEGPSGQVLVIVPPGGWYPAFKAVSDVLVAAVLLVLLSPVIVLTAIFIRLDSKGPIFYTQVRVGRYGRVF